MEPKKIDEINEKSEYVQDLLGKVPSKILMYGSTLVLLFLLAALLLSYLIKYPDVVNARITLTSANPPVHVFSPVAGNLKQLLVADNQKVDVKTNLAVIDNAANLEDVQLLEQFLAGFDSVSNFMQLESVLLPRKLSLGNIQDAFTDFTMTVERIQLFLKKQSLGNKRSTLLSDIAHLDQLESTYAKQNEIVSAELKNAQTNLERNKILFKQKVISRYELEQIESSMLRNKNDLENLNSVIINNRNLLSEKKSLLSLLGIENQESLLENFVMIKQKAQVVKALIETWKHVYLIRSPVAGYISFHTVWTQNQYIKANEDMFVVVPNTRSELIGKLTLPEMNSGRVKPGQRVIIRLDGYNYKTFGTINGMVSSISPSIKESTFSINVKLPKQLITSYGITISNTTELNGVASVVTEDLRLIERIFYNIRAAFSNN
jgi:multidrug resistance efflux pump